jgi:hypothetical protein
MMRILPVESFTDKTADRAEPSLVLFVILLFHPRQGLKRQKNP